MEEDQSKGFKGLKRRSVLDNIKKYSDQFVKDSQMDRDFNKSVNWSLRKRIKDGLLCEEVDNESLWNKFNNCGFSNEKKCGLFWCNRCRETLKLVYEGKVQKNIIKCESNNDDLKMLSGVVGLNKVDSSEVIESLNKDNNRWKRVRRRLKNLKGNKFINSVYEFELVNGLFLMNSVGRDNEFKKDMIRSLVEKDKKFRINDIFIFNHFHSISNLNDDELMYVCGDDFKDNKGNKLKKMSDCGLYVRKFIKDKRLRDNVRKLCSYNFKSVYRFKYSFVGSDYKNGEYLNNIELGKLISLYDKVSGRGYRRLFRELKNY